jgi:pterin-4a-carbinolamine dehydratase
VRVEIWSRAVKGLHINDFIMAWRCKLKPVFASTE